jgi:hypothetical protein
VFVAEDVRLVSGYEYEQNMAAVSVRPTVTYTYCSKIFKISGIKADYKMIY